MNTLEIKAVIKLNSKSFDFSWKGKSELSLTNQGMTKEALSDFTEFFKQVIKEQLT